MFDKEKNFFFWTEKLFYNQQKLLTDLNWKYVVISYPLKKIQVLFVLFLYTFIPWTPLIAFESRDHLMIDKLVKSCYKDSESCSSALYKIHKYQKKSAIKKKFSCQTRLLGLEANLIMAMNANLKKKDAESIIKAVKKYC